ncbi:MAG: quinate 5-dehydrogenase [Chloroflexi bacterium]|nr:MAG: quinate 5-dehydrogenase [Chloroflexota bacterium]RLC82729.1 MAG: quinate 5-dehydrogenase [Chloroflexota bacterium]
MKRAVSVSLGSSSRDKKVIVKLKGKEISVERIGTDGDVPKAQRLYAELDGKVDAFGMGGADMYLRLDDREYPLHAALKLIKDVHQTPVVDGRGLKHTLERRLWELAEPELGDIPHFHCAFVPVAVDRLGLGQAVSDVSDEVIFGDLMVALGVPIPVRGIKNFRRVARVMLPFVSYFPMSMIFYGSGGAEHEPKYQRYWEQADLIAGDFLFMRKYMPHDITGKTIVTNTTTAENVELVRERGARMLITTTPRFEGRSFGTNMMEAALTAYAGQGRPLTDAELNTLIDELDLRPSVQRF